MFPNGFGRSLMQKLVGTPRRLWYWTQAKTDTLLYESAQLASFRSLTIRPEQMEALRIRLTAPEPAAGAFRRAENGTEGITSAERSLVRRIREETARHNRNNVARTRAYWAIYLRNPELHWAFLAHMVSRNGGWSMADLKGELLPNLLDSAQLESVFGLLERSNALIFHDAYPQLLLYEASRREGTPLFRLLRELEVSRFMQPVWELFWTFRDSTLLTFALIINEQLYIQKRVIEHPLYRHTVLDTLFFSIQSLLQLNQAMIPYFFGDRVRLAGLTIERFSSPDERIGVGKALYAMLFGIPAVARGAARFASQRAHTGSRADYWPHLFDPVRRSPLPPGGLKRERLEGGYLKPGAVRLYSPVLANAWRDYPMAEAEPGDWFADDAGRCLSHFGSVKPPFSFDLSQAHSLGLNRIELAVLAQSLIK